MVDTKLYRSFEVINPFEIEAGIIAPAYNNNGFGIQLLSPVREEVLVKRDIIKPSNN